MNSIMNYFGVITSGDLIIFSDLFANNDLFIFCVFVILFALLSRFHRITKETILRIRKRLLSLSDLIVFTYCRHVFSNNTEVVDYQGKPKRQQYYSLLIKATKYVCSHS
jgi:hypothetical protein